MDEWRDAVVAGVGSPRRQQLGLEAPMRELFLSEVGVLHEDTEEGQTFYWQGQGDAAEKESSSTCRVGGDTGLCGSIPLTSCLEQKLEAEDEKSMEDGGGEFCPECSQRATLGLGHV